MQRAGLLAVLLVACAPPESPPTLGFRAPSFPDGFMFGTATAQWQIEGAQGVNGPVASNWTTWLEMGKGNGQQNPDGNGAFTAFADDVARAKDLGLDAFRLGVDWSRIEPQRGVWDDDELDHFVAEVRAVKDAGLDPVVTLWHWTVPLWVQDPDTHVDLLAASDDAILDDWEAFVRHVVPRIAADVDTYTVLNEPFSMISAGYLNGAFPPGKILAIEEAKRFGVKLIRMQARAYDAIKDLDDDAFVGLTMTANGIYPEHPGDADEEFAATHLSYIYNDWIPIALTTGKLDLNLDEDADDEGEAADSTLAGRLDFIGVQYYGPVEVRADQLFVNLDPLYGLPLLDVDDYDPQRPHNGMGREIWAAGLRDTLDIYAKHGLPLIVTENGTTTNRRPVFEGETATLAFDEPQAAMYVVEHLWEVGRAIQRGVDVRGYFHWSIADNHEWVEGRLQRFGAYGVDFDDPDRPRTLTQMGEALRDVVTARAVDEAIWNTWVLDCYPTDERDDCGPTVSEPVVGPLP